MCIDKMIDIEEFDGSTSLHIFGKDPWCFSE